MQGENFSAFSYLTLHARSRQSPPNATRVSPSTEFIPTYEG